ncbi:hypothetical protein ACU4GD_29960, partial [Cupriavidus basilensis]
MVGGSPSPRSEFAIVMWSRRTGTLAQCEPDAALEAQAAGQSSWAPREGLQAFGKVVTWPARRLRLLEDRLRRRGHRHPAWPPA